MNGLKEKATKRHSRDKTYKKFAVIFYNDDFTTIEFVIACLMLVFDYSLENAKTKTLQIHKGTQGVAGTYSEKLAKAKRDTALQMARGAGFNKFRIGVEEL